MEKIQHTSFEKSDDSAVNIAMTTWGNRISPVFDSAKTLMIARVEHSKVTSRTFEKVSPCGVLQVLSILSDYKVDALICGAITDQQSEPIKQSGVKLIPFLSGNADKVLGSYIQTPQKIINFLMPGADDEPKSV